MGYLLKFKHRWSIITLKDLDLKIAYDSDEDDVLSDFYVPALSNAVKYQRLAGYFSSASLAVAAEGISSFLHNDGTMDLIMGAYITKKDVDAVNLGLDEKEKIDNAVNLFSEFATDDLLKLKDEIVTNHVKALAWMIAKGRLNIKIAILVDPKGNLLDIESAARKGIFHEKVGILTDVDNNAISFSGSINETSKGWLDNIEEFKVFKSWDNYNFGAFESDEKKFSKYWNNKSFHTTVVDIPLAIKEQLIKIAPESIEELLLDDYQRQTKKRIKLHDYQKLTRDAWLRNKKGILEMATGTGKTYVAISCLRELWKELYSEPFLVIISVPFKHLIYQWKDNLVDWNYDCNLLIHGQSNWQGQLLDLIRDLKLGIQKNAIIITTHDSLSSEKFISIIDKVSFPILYISDEVHAIGSKTRLNGLLDNYNYRLGLSATPTRYFDDEGTNNLVKYFGGIIEEEQIPLPFTIKDAIQKGFLVEYNYFLKVVELTDEEWCKYIELTKKIGYHLGENNENKQDDELTKLFLFKRAKLVESAENKYNALTNILKEIKSITHTLIYVTELQKRKVSKILDDFSLIYYNFTDKDIPKIAQRLKILKNFGDGVYDALIAIRILDEGVDVPSTRNAIILASTGNPKQFIQRRGRVLRLDKKTGKKHANIYDVLVVPTLNPNSQSEYFNLEQSLLKKQLKRIEEFSNTSKNPTDSSIMITDIKVKYCLD